MPDLTLTDLGTKEGGITPDQLVFAVMKSVTASIVTATAKAAADIAKTGGATAAESVKQVGGAIKNLFGGEKKKP
jgi:Mrp family chromosome partitioning ATPase